jgi:hypothetical protein
VSLLSRFKAPRLGSVVCCCESSAERGGGECIGQLNDRIHRSGRRVKLRNSHTDVLIGSLEDSGFQGCGVMSMGEQSYTLYLSRRYSGKCLHLRSPKFHYAIKRALHTVPYP